jgi:hypothetical protein
MKPIFPCLFALVVLVSGTLTCQQHERSSGGWSTFIKQADGSPWRRAGGPVLAAFGRGLLLPRDLLALKPQVKLAPPAPTRDPALALQVSTNLEEACNVAIDVDLNHDGRFDGAGELGYAETFLTTSQGEVILHGLIHGRYQTRARSFEEKSLLHSLPARR